VLWVVKCAECRLIGGNVRRYCARLDRFAEMVWIVVDVLD